MGITAAGAHCWGNLCVSSGDLSSGRLGSTVVYTPGELSAPLLRLKFICNLKVIQGHSGEWQSEAHVWVPSWGRTSLYGKICPFGLEPCFKHCCALYWEYDTLTLKCCLVFPWALDDWPDLWRKCLLDKLYLGLSCQSSVLMSQPYILAVPLNRRTYKISYVLICWLEACTKLAVSDHWGSGSELTSSVRNGVDRTWLLWTDEKVFCSACALIFN